MAKCFHCHKTAAPGYMFCGMHLKSLQRIDTTTPAPTTEPTAKPITGLTEEECIAILKMGRDSVFMAQAITRALAEKNGLAVQGEKV